MVRVGNFLTMGVAFSAMLACVPCRAQQDGLTSPAIDSSIFAPGSVTGFSQTYGAWTTKCQEIVKLRQRVCNLVSPLYSKDGKENGFILIGTDDAGKATALVTLPGAIDVSVPISIQTQYAVQAKKKKKTATVLYKKDVKASTCGGTCKYMLPAEPALIFSLNSGNSAAVVVQQVPDPAAVVPGFAYPSVQTTLSIRGDGFAQALQASMKK